MGTINEKLRYLNDTKDYFKRALMGKGITVNDSDTFRDYYRKLNTYTSDADAKAEDILEGKKAYVNNQLIIGVAPRGVKAFESIEEMEASTGNSKGEKALLLSETYINFDGDGNFEYVKFPETVVLPYAVENDIQSSFTDVETGYKNFDCFLYANGFTFIAEGIYVSYSSSDGINYTRNTYDEKIECPEKYIFREGNWNDLLGYFIQVRTYDVEGIYEYDGVNWNLVLEESGGIDTSDATATAEDMALGKTAYVNGEKVTGNLEEIVAEQSVLVSGDLVQVYLGETSTEEAVIFEGTEPTDSIYRAGSKKSLYAPFSEVANAIELTSDKIAQGETVLGIEGTFEGGTGEYNTIVNPVLTSVNSSIAKNITYLPTIDFNAVTTANACFQDMRNLTHINIVNTGNVTNFNSTFKGCANLKKVNDDYIDTSSGTNFESTYHQCTNLEKHPVMDTSKGTTFVNTFASCSALKTVEIDTSNATNISSMCEGSGVETLPMFNCENVNRASNVIYNCLSLKNCGGFKDLGKAFTQKTANYSYYKINLSRNTLMTHDSLMNIINNLYDLNLTYDVANGGTLYTQTLQLGNTLIALLTEEEIAICNSKGWSVS